MPQFINVPLPLLAGLDQSIDPRITPVGKLLDCNNGFFDKTGAISQRSGFTKFTVDTSDGGTLPEARGIFSTGEELCVLTKRALYAYSPQHARWYDKGPVSPFNGRVASLHRDEFSYQQADLDLDTTGKYILSAAVRKRQVDPDTGTTSYEQAVLITVRDIDGSVVIPPTPYSATTAIATKPHAVRVAHCTGKLLALFMTSIAAGAHNIDAYEYATATPATPPGAPVGLAIADAYDAQTNVRIYDACALSNGNYLLAYCQHAAAAPNAVIIQIRSPAHAVLFTATLNAPAGGWYERVAVCDGPGTDVYVLTYLDGAANDQIDVRAFSRAALALTWGPTLFDNPDTARTVENVGIVAGDGRVVGTWTIYYTSPEHELHSRSCDLAGGGVDTEAVSYNTHSRSRPFCYGTRCYCVVGSSLEDTEFEVSNVVDLQVNEAAGRSGFHETVGTFDVGVGGSVLVGLSSDMETCNFGSANTVITSATGIFRTASLSNSWHQADDLATKFAADELTMEFLNAPLIATVTRGAALIGGGKFSWYAGDQVEELGFVSAPVIVSAVPSRLPALGFGAGHLTLGQTYRYQAIWQIEDICGNIHRSLPCAYVSAGPLINDGVGNQDSVTLRFRSMPFSRRFLENYRGASIIVYRSAENDGGVFKQCSSPLYVALNTRSSCFVTWYDSGDLYSAAGGIYTTLGTPIYTTSGEIEAVQPEGARVVSVAAERVWLGDFYRRDRIQYSKRYTPGTAAEFSIAPEFNEGFGLTVPSGKRVTGLAELDDAMVVFADSEVYIIGGRGPDDNGANNDFSGLQQLSNDVGCIESRSVCSFPEGIVFQGQGGLYILNRAHQIMPMEAVCDKLVTYPIITSAVMVQEKKQVRLTATNSTGSAGIILVFDYRMNSWTYWSPKSDAGVNLPFVGACMHEGVYYTIQATGQLWRENSAASFDDTAQFVPLQIESTWFQGSNQGGWQRIRYVSALCERRGPHGLKFSVYNDFEPATNQTRTWTDTEITSWPGTPREQPVMHVNRQNCQAFKLRVESVASVGAATGEGFTCAGFTVTMKPKRGMFRAGDAQRS